MPVDGLEEALEVYDAAAQAVGESLADVAHAAIVDEFRRRASKIPFATGALRKALTTPRDRFHHAEVTPSRKGWFLSVGVRGTWDAKAPNPLRAAVFQGQRRPRRIPQPVTRKVVEAVHAAYEASLPVGRGNDLAGDVTIGRIRKKNKRRSRGRRRR